MAKYLCEADMSTGEYISRDEALKIFHQCCDNCTSSYNGVMCRACADADAMDILIDIPAADVQPIKHGRWIDIYEWAKMHDSTPSGMCLYYWCSECQKEQEKKSNFCPNCGAKMDIIYEDDKIRAIKVTGWDDDTRNLTDEETEIYESWIDHEAKDAGVNIMDGDTNG